MLRHRPQAFVERLDFLTTAGYLGGRDARQRAGFTGGGLTKVVTDPGVLEPDSVTRELVLTATHSGVDVDRVRGATGWPLRVADPVRTTGSVSERELLMLRDLKARTAAAHGASR